MGRRFVDVRQQSELKTEKNPQPNLTIYTTSNLKRRGVQTKIKKRRKSKFRRGNHLNFKNNNKAQSHKIFHT